VVSASFTSSSVWYSPGESAEASGRQPLRDGRRGHTLGQQFVDHATHGVTFVQILGAWPSTMMW
jgi:hypothetical protein